MDVWPGSTDRLGATVTDDGTNFAVASEIAYRVWLCLFDEGGSEHRLPLDVSAGIWHGFVPGLAPGTQYGYRVEGPFRPEAGLHCNVNKLLVDPYAYAITGGVTWSNDLIDHAPDNPEVPSPTDSAALVPRSVVVDPSFDWEDDERPSTSLRDSVLYETHVKGFSQRLATVPKALRGTFAGLKHPNALKHLVGLGVTGVVLMPTAQSVTPEWLARLGFIDYWGYHTLSLLAPHDGYSAAVRAGRVGEQVLEFQQMVKGMHGVGLQVIIDLPVGHTAEEGMQGLTLNYHGLDAPAYYGPPQAEQNTLGRPRSLNFTCPLAIRLLMDALRYWVATFHVDGFRLLDVGGRHHMWGATEPLPMQLTDLIEQDPLISRGTLLITSESEGQSVDYSAPRFLSERWGMPGPDFGKELGCFWRGDDYTLGMLASALMGSADLYSARRTRPGATINVLTSHRGMTLRDIVSYDRTHNDGNPPGDRRTPYSWPGAGAEIDETRAAGANNCGIEGDSDDPAVLALRRDRSRALLATLLLSQGVPMLLGGDEMARTQRGSSGVYWLDDPVTWFDWQNADNELLAFTARLVNFRRAHPVLHRSRYITDTAWYRPDGEPQSANDWDNPLARAIMLHLRGDQCVDLSPFGCPLIDDDILLLVNGWREPVDFIIPRVTAPSVGWELVIQTATLQQADKSGTLLSSGSRTSVPAHAVLVLHSKAVAGLAKGTRRVVLPNNVD